MALVIADRVRETTTTTGTGAVTLAGAYTSFQSFLAAVGNGNSTYYTIASAVTGEWEVGIGTYTSASNTLSRTTVLASSNAGSLVNFSSGAKDVFVTQPAERSILVQSAGSGLFSGVAAFTANGVPYASSTSTLTTGSALTFDGTNLGVGAAASGKFSVDFGNYVGVGARFQYNSSNLPFCINALNNAGDTYISWNAAAKSGSDTATRVIAAAATKIEGGGGQFIFYNTTSSTAGSDISWTEQMRVTSTGVGIGTSSPGAKLDVVGLTKITASQNLILNGATGTYSTVQYNGTSIGDIGTGNQVYSGGTTTDLAISARPGYRLVLGSNGTPQVYLDSSGNLALGVAPSAFGGTYKGFQIGQGGLMSRTGGSDVYLLGNNYYDGTNFRYINTSFASRYQQDSGAHAWFIAPSGTAGNAITFTQAMTLDASGNLGIGTSSPGSFAGTVKAVVGGGSGNPVLTLYGGNSTYGGIYFADGTTGNELYRGFFEYNHSTDSLLIGTAASTKATLDSSGNLGLGVTPSAWGTGRNLEVANINFNIAGTLSANAYNNAGWKYETSSNPATSYVQSGGTHSWFTAPSGTAGNAITFTQAMTLTAAGRLGVGITAPNSILEVASAAGTSGQTDLFVRNTTSGTAMGLVKTGSSYSYAGVGANSSWVYSQGSDTLSLGPDGDAPITFVSNGSERARIDSSGNLGLGVTPSAWISSGKAIDIAGFGSVAQTSSGSFASSFNAYQNSAANWIYKTTNAAAQYQCGLSGLGQHAWFIAPSGTAGDAITFTQAMTLDASGNLLVGTTTSGGAYATFGNNSGPGANRWASVFGTNSASAGNPSSFGLTVGWNYSSGGGENNVIYGISGGSSPGLAFSSYNGTTVIERARLDSSGNLGLGVTPSASWSGQSAFQVNTRSAFAGSSNFTAVATNAIATSNGWAANYLATGTAALYTQSVSTGAHAWYTAPSGTAGDAITFTQAMTLDASGNLAIGTTSPVAKLTVTSGTSGVQGAFGYGAGLNYITVGYAGNTSSYHTRFGYDVTAEYGYIQAYAAAGVADDIAINPSGGNLLVGSTSNASGTPKLYVQSNDANMAARFYSTGISDSQHLIYFDKPSTTNTTSQVFVGFTINSQATGSGQINANGASQAAFGSFSDRRLKENIVDLPPQLDNIMALRPVEFDYIESEGGGHQVSFIAQEFETVYPDAVGERADGMKTLTGWGKTEARLVKAIQEQQALIQQLTARVAQLESN